LETAQPVPLGRYVGKFAAWFVGALIIFSILARIFPEIAAEYGKHISFAITIASVMAAYQLFLKEQQRLLSDSEYWRMVGLCSAVAAAAAVAQLMLIWSAGELPPLSPGLWIFVLFIAAVVTIVPVLLGFSKRAGNSLLKAEARRQAKANAKSN
jgi:peptidoglycan/LPS O-acetylase OafA/YrhL